MKSGLCTSIFVLLPVVVLLTACTGHSNLTSSGATSGECLNGFSGMDYMEDSSYLAVHDRKAHQGGDRLSIIQTRSESNFILHTVHVDNWKHSDGPASDLEAICRLDERDHEYLAVESGHWGGKYGRLFHLKLDSGKSPRSASVITAYDLPEFDSKGPSDPHGDEFEGLECASMDNNTVLVILGERGGSDAYANGRLRWFSLDPEKQTLTWTNVGKTGKTIDAPGVWVDPSRNRDITALHLDENQVLWAIASEDAGDAGPFKSLLYRIGTVKPAEPDPIQLLNSFTVMRRSDGLKIEALAGPSDAIPGSRHAIATEDECFGGVWRSLQ